MPGGGGGSWEHLRGEPPWPHTVCTQQQGCVLGSSATDLSQELLLPPRETGGPAQPLQLQMLWEMLGLAETGCAMCCCAMDVVVHRGGSTENCDVDSTGTPSWADPAHTAEGEFEKTQPWATFGSGGSAGGCSATENESVVCYCWAG